MAEEKADAPDYEPKYCKYKEKYYKLKQKLNNELYLSFITENIMELKDKDLYGGEIEKRKKSMDDHEQTNPAKRPNKMTQHEEQKQRTHMMQLRTGRKPPKKHDEYTKVFTPELINMVSPEKMEYFAHDIKLDDEAIKRITNIAEEEDADYKFYENHGKRIECWIADNMVCPSCKRKTLRRYEKNNMAVIDMLCINPEHDKNQVRFFQVKTSNGKEFLGKNYFSKDPPSIHVGSINFGCLIHNIKPSDDENLKKTLIGYICIYYSLNNDIIKINNTTSFIVLPKLELTFKSTRKKLDFNETTNLYVLDENWYYKYIDKSKHPIITFNINTNNINDLREYFGGEKNVSLNIINDKQYNVILNPFIVKN